MFVILVETWKALTSAILPNFSAELVLENKKIKLVLNY